MKLNINIHYPKKCGNIVFKGFDLFEFSNFINISFTDTYDFILNKMNETEINVILIENTEKIYDLFNIDQKPQHVICLSDGRSISRIEKSLERHTNH